MIIINRGVIKSNPLNCHYRRTCSYGLIEVCEKLRNNFSLEMDLKTFCNRCLQQNKSRLLVTSCRHVLCSACYAKCNRRCGLCQSRCKVIAFADLPEEMAVYFKPIMPVLKKYLKIAQFQLQQRSLWTTKRKYVLERTVRRRELIREKKQKLQQIKEGYRRLLQKNTELKKQLKIRRRAEPKNPFEMNSGRNRPQDDEDINREVRGHQMHSSAVMGTPAGRSFNSSTKSSLFSNSNASSVIGHSPVIGGRATQRGMNSTVNSTLFFNGSHISASSSLNSSGSTSKSSRYTDQLRRLLQETSIRSPKVSMEH